MAKANKNNTEEPIEKQLWKTADKLRKNIDAAEYKHIILGLIFLKYISDAFEELFDKLKKVKANIPAPIRKTKTNTRRRMSFLCRKLPAGLICNPKPNCRKSAKRLTTLWMPLKRTILRFGMYYRKSMPEATSTPPILAV
ncbi:MAG: type I restriction-modification system subunit M N-terminal domain-containing protein [Desulfobacterales bacterium]|nr:type I restriction-modification system subunit M N-terminal domain-containing protein [Desulfobacterales bacterium]